PHWPCPANNLHALTGLNGHIGFLGNHPGLAAIQTDRNFQPPFALNTLFYRIACQATQQGTTHSRQNFTAPAPDASGRSPATVTPGHRAPARSPVGLDGIRSPPFDGAMAYDLVTLGLAVGLHLT